MAHCELAARRRPPPGPRAARTSGSRRASRFSGRGAGDRRRRERREPPPAQRAAPPPPSRGGPRRRRVVGPAPVARSPYVHPSGCARGHRQGGQGQGGRGAAPCFIGVTGRDDAQPREFAPRAGAGDQPHGRQESPRLGRWGRGGGRTGPSGPGARAQRGTPRVQSEGGGGRGRRAARRAPPPPQARAPPPPPATANFRSGAQFTCMWAAGQDASKLRSRAGWGTGACGGSCRRRSVPASTLGSAEGAGGRRCCGGA
jgi:hypothetical protein